MLKHITVFLLALLLFSQPAFANLTRIPVTPKAQKQFNVHFSLSIKEEGNIYRIDYYVPREGNLKDLFEVALSVYHGDQPLLSRGQPLLYVPLVQYNPYWRGQKLPGQFRIAKEWLKGAVLHVRTRSGSSEHQYEIPLAAYLLQEPSSEQPAAK